MARELEEAYEAAKADPKFHEEVDWYRKEYIGGPTPMYHAKRLSAELGGAQVCLNPDLHGIATALTNTIFPFLALWRCLAVFLTGAVLGLV